MITHKTAPFASVIMGLSLTGCSSLNTLSLGVEDPCASLNGIIGAYPSAFADYRGKGNNFNSVTVYAAKEQIIRGHCEIWNWANNDSAYVCSANNPNQEVAMARYQTAIDSVGQCLGSNWQSKETERTRNGKNAGNVTRFQSAESGQPSVAIHRVSYRGDSSVYLYVGTPARLEDY